AAGNANILSIVLIHFPSMRIPLFFPQLNPASPEDQQGYKHCGYEYKCFSKCIVGSPVKHNHRDHVRGYAGAQVIVYLADPRVYYPAEVYDGVKERHSKESKGHRGH